ncbi:MAG: glycosyl transferase [Calditrichaceae bacterium]|nr:glycosyl transferase [Calditrichaceae bacterium]MBN2708327.1 glycosyl transferase [Calditrichaceae bacterium]RQV95216.1 MAG: glycosyl transferase [Calditrichota bacterium]
MSDFFQNGTITTLHNLKKMSLEELEQKLSHYAITRPISLILPSLYSELEGEALPNIINELKKVSYLGEIVIGLDKASKEEFDKAKKFFSQLHQPHKIIWNRGPRIQELFKLLEENNLSAGSEGKGRNVWICLGYIIAHGLARVIALHDCDILTYDRSLLARLVYPIASTNMNFRFCKGYYSRVSDRLNGRVARLFITPFVRAMNRILGHIDYLDFIDSFRYPLAGEISIHKDVAHQLRLPTDWGLEIGTLNEIYRNYAKNQMCQVDILDNYDHKHQDLGEENPNAGLAKMSIDIAKSFYRVLAGRGVIFSDQYFRTIKASYLRTALDFLEQYSHDAEINGLVYNRHAEEKAIEVFLRSIILAGDQFLANPLELPSIPNWNRIQSAIPEFYEMLIHAVELDNQ